MTYKLIQDLCESRVFRSRDALNRYSDTQIKNYFYTYLLSSVTLAVDSRHADWGKQYLSRTSAFSNFDMFRSSGTDLYVLAYRTGELVDTPLVGQRLVVTMRALAQGRLNTTQLSAYMMRLERALGIRDHRLSNIRRQLSSWNSLSSSAQRTQYGILQRLIMGYSPAAEVLPLLRSAQGTGSVGKNAAIIAAAGLGGFMLGLSYDPQKRMKFMDSQGDAMSDEYTEDLSIADFARQLENNPMVDRVENVEHTDEGVTAVVTGTDGTVYAMAFTVLDHKPDQSQ